MDKGQLCISSLKVLAMDESTCESEGVESGVWVPPKARDRQGNLVAEDSSTVVEERGHSAKQLTSAVLESMDLIVDGRGFLVPRTCKKKVDDQTVDNEIFFEYDEEDSCSSENDDDYSTSSSSDTSDDPEYSSTASIPYCRLMPAALEEARNAAHKTPSKARRSVKSNASTRDTETLTKTPSSSSRTRSYQDGVRTPSTSSRGIYSDRRYPTPPRSSSHNQIQGVKMRNTTQSPRGSFYSERGYPTPPRSSQYPQSLEIPDHFEVQNDDDGFSLISPMPTLSSPGWGSWEQKQKSSPYDDIFSPDDDEEEVNHRSKVSSSERLARNHSTGKGKKKAISESFISNAPRIVLTPRKLASPQSRSSPRKTPPSMRSLGRNKSDLASGNGNHRSPRKQSIPARGMNRVRSDSGHGGIARRHSCDPHSVSSKMEELRLNPPEILSPCQSQRKNFHGSFHDSDNFKPEWSSNSKQTFATEGPTLSASTGRSSTMHSSSPSKRSTRSLTEHLGMYSKEYSPRRQLSCRRISSNGFSQPEVEDYGSSSLDAEDNVSAADAVIIKTRKVTRSTPKSPKKPIRRSSSQRPSPRRSALS